MIYNPETIRSILITTYRRDQLVIGYAPAVVKAGATATTYATVDDIAAQTDVLLNAFAASGSLPAAQFSTYFQVAINDSVARSLNLVIDDSVRELRLRSQPQPEDEGQDRNRQDSRHEDASDLIGETLNGRATALGDAVLKDIKVVMDFAANKAAFH